jgi:xylulokinase
MWVEALELLFERARAGGAPLGAVAAISGSGQQHGTVYLAAGIGSIDFAAADGLVAAVAPRLSRRTAPIWMDSSTTEDCRAIEQALGGAEEVRRRTGSAATERFSGPQIRRFARTDPDAYARTAVIHLVSSFLCSLLAGRDAPIDYGDGAGMNLLNLATGDWDDELLEATAPGLREKLPPPVPSHQLVGPISPVLAKRFGLDPGAVVVVWSGDNPNSLIGTGGWRPGGAVVSLGTSDTFFAAMPQPRVDPRGCGHVFGNPAGGFMSLICFKNGSLAREAVRDRFGLSWEAFNAFLIEGVPGGGEHNLMLPYFVPEITPPVLEPGPVYRGGAALTRGNHPGPVVRALVESQALSMRLHSDWMGVTPTRLRLTGGASASDGICRIFADVFQAEVLRLEGGGDSAALGAAMRAAQAVEGLSWQTLTERFCAVPPGGVIAPNPATRTAYRELAERYAALEAGHLAAG